MRNCIKVFASFSNTLDERVPKYRRRQKSTQRNDKQPRRRQNLLTARADRVCWRFWPGRGVDGDGHAQLTTAPLAMQKSWARRNLGQYLIDNFRGGNDPTCMQKSRHQRLRFAQGRARDSRNVDGGGKARKRGGVSPYKLRVLAQADLMWWYFQLNNDIKQNEDAGNQLLIHCSPARLAHNFGYVTFNLAIRLARESCDINVRTIFLDTLDDSVLKKHRRK